MTTFPFNAPVRPGRLRFSGSYDAELFTREIQESGEGVLVYSMQYGGPEGVDGFVLSAEDSRAVGATMWSRDAGTFLRELANYGYLEHARRMLKANLELVEKNEQGYYAVPTYFWPGKKQAGSEVDGTAAMLIGMVDLWYRLEPQDGMRKRIQEFVFQPASPLYLFEKQLNEQELIPGSGEFGAGNELDTSVCVHNVVQNQLVFLAFRIAARLARHLGEDTTAQHFERLATRLEENILRYFVGEDGCWMWCIASDTKKEVPEIRDAITNVGFGGINGVACMYSDVFGLTAFREWKGAEVCRKTFFKLHDAPVRKYTFDKYGMWIQFEKDHEGLLTSASYGQGYAIQTMLLMEEQALADKALAYLATATCYKPAFYHLTRRSDFYFYERYYSPEALGVTPIEEGCGALNVVNVAEPMKVARMVMGLDNVTDTLCLVPRLPEVWTKAVAEDWPVVTRDGVVRADITYTVVDGALNVAISVRDGGVIPEMQISVPDASGQRQLHCFADVRELSVSFAR